jgi:hypothetical protein
VVTGLLVVLTDLPDHGWEFQVQKHQNYPSIFSPNDAEHLCPRYLHHKKPIKTDEFQGEFHFRMLKPKKLLVV